MKQLIILLFFAFFASAHSQNEKIIKAEVTKKGEHDSTTMSYYTLNSLIQLRDLGPGKYRFYIGVGVDCKMFLVTDKGTKLSKEDTDRFNEVLAEHVIEYYYDGNRVMDCSKFSNRTFPVSIVKE